MLERWVHGCPFAVFFLWVKVLSFLPNSLPLLRLTEVNAVARLTLIPYFTSPPGDFVPQMRQPAKPSLSLLDFEKQLLG